MGVASYGHEHTIIDYKSTYAIYVYLQWKL